MIVAGIIAPFCAATEVARGCPEFDKGSEPWFAPKEKPAELFKPFTIVSIDPVGASNYATADPRIFIY